MELPHAISKEETMRYYHTTGLIKEETEPLYQRLKEIVPVRKKNSRPPALDLWDQMIVMLLLVRQNMTQETVADLFEVSQPTISRIWRTMLAAFTLALEDVGIPLEEAAADRCLLVDGTYVRTGNRQDKGKDLYSGKRKCQCVNIQVACDLNGTLIAVSDPVDGKTHDRKALTDTGWESILEKANWVADMGYIGTTAITPTRKPRGGELTDEEKSNNHDIAVIRNPIERCNSHLKNWKILRTGYRGRLADLPTVIHIVAKLLIYTYGWDL